MVISNSLLSPDAGDLATVANVRTIAASLALSPDTVARALRTLRDHGLATMEQSREDGGARFGGARYHLSPVQGLGLQRSDTSPHTVRPDTERSQPESPHTVSPSTSIPSSDNAHDSRKDRRPLDRDRALPMATAGRPQGDQMALLDLLA
jgi:DNA-binding transcriptional ArsR family regulator